jgi:hypothetical protein
MDEETEKCEYDMAKKKSEFKSNISDIFLRGLHKKDDQDKSLGVEAPSVMMRKRMK